MVGKNSIVPLFLGHRKLFSSVTIPLSSVIEKHLKCPLGHSKNENENLVVMQEQKC